MGLMVPGSTLMYGSSLSMVTLRPRDSRIAASEAAAIPLPREDPTPPVTKTNLVIVLKVPNGTRGKFELYLKPANTSSGQRNKRATWARPRQRPQPIHHL